MAHPVRVLRPGIWALLLAAVAPGMAHQAAPAPGAYPQARLPARIRPVHMAHRADPVRPAALAVQRPAKRIVLAVPARLAPTVPVWAPILPAALENNISC